MKNTLLLLFALCILCFSCNKDDDPVVAPVKINPTNKFVMEVMQQAYLWSDQIPELDISTYEDPKVLFDDILYKKYDKWSIITDDFPALLKRFEGISKSFGSVIQLSPFSNSSNLFGVVLYVYKNTPAEKAGLKRGDIIMKINDIALTESNYAVLLGKDTYTLTLGELTDKGIGVSSTKLTMTREEINEDPILHHQVYEKEGKKIGYLMYDSFIHRYDDDLKQVFADFKANNVTDLILDLRYNSGGDDVSARLLASLIAPKDAVGTYFYKSVYNATYTRYYKENPDIAEEQNADGMKFEDVAEGLGLKKVIVLTSGMSASSSELVINGLDPVMDVYLIGTTTHGKCTGMRGFADDNKNPKWGMFPVVVKASNSEGVTDYFDGFAPDEKVIEDLPLLPFGSESDPLITAALAKITGVPAAAPSLKVGKIKYEVLDVVGDKPEVCKNILMR